VKFIEANKDRPFYLNLSHYAVHTPIQAKKDLRERFDAKAKDPAKGHTNAAYAAMIKSVDDSIGRVLRKLDDLGLTDNTVVIFTSDNGGYGPVTSNYPLRGNKGNFYEGGIRVPAIIKWPGVTQAGSVSHDVIIGADFYRTLLEMAGLPLRPEQHKDALSLVPVLKRTGGLKRDAVYWHFPNYIGGGHPNPSKPCSVIRAGPWKLIESLEDNSVELFDLKSDLQERADLAQERPEKVAALRKMLERHRKEAKVQMPRVNPDYVAR
jgi:arylsulfatase A